jgi:hypothetical protein
MMMKPSERYRSVIEPAYNDYVKEPLSERLANSLAAAIDHQIDWAFAYYEAVDRSRLDGATNVKSFRRKLVAQCTPLQVMNDLSDAAHHRFLTRKNDPARAVVASTAAYSMQSGALQIPAYNVPFLPTANGALDFWRKWQD